MSKHKKGGAIDRYAIVLAGLAGVAAWTWGSRRRALSKSSPTGSGEIPQRALDLIKKWEGFRSGAYLDPVGIPTIGYGTTYYPSGAKVQLGETVDKPTAESYLRHYLEQKARPKLGQLPNWSSMTTGQRSALYSFAYNLGPNFYPKYESISQALESSGWVFNVPEAFKKYVYAKGQKLPGLVNRRQDEISTWWS